MSFSKEAKPIKPPNIYVQFRSKKLDQLKDEPKKQAKIEELWHNISTTQKKQLEDDYQKRKDQYKLNLEAWKQKNDPKYKREKEEKRKTEEKETILIPPPQKMSISLDKIEAQRQNLIKEQMIKAEKASMKIDNNFRILMNSIPPALLDQNVGALLKAFNHDLNAAIANEYQQMKNQNNVHSKASKTTQLDDEKIESNAWDTKIWKSPPKLFPQKRIIKNSKKK